MSDKAQIQILTQKLEDVYCRIEREQMANIPILNSSLKVKAIGFRKWEKNIVGILLTPWFMNLMLFPSEDNSWAKLPKLSKVNHSFPSGVYEFIVGYEPSIGDYQICSLFSPVFEFVDQDSAVTTALAVMKALMEEVNESDISGRYSNIEHHMAKDASQKNNSKEDLCMISDKSDIASLDEISKKTISRRDMLRGNFLPNHNRKK